MASLLVLGGILFLIGAALFVHAFRGRVAQRGVFCRPCRFDLAGLDIDSVDARCPECGGGICNETSRRGVLRKRSKAGLLVAVFLLAVGGSALSLGYTGKSAVLYSYLPDTPLVWLAGEGSDGALDELVQRISTINPKDALKSWTGSINAGLKHQKDTTVVWDRRWGEALYQACVKGKMNAAQLEAYITQSNFVDVQIRDRVHQGSNGVAFNAKFSGDRIRAITGGTTGYERTIFLAEYGQVGRPALYTGSGSGIRGVLGTHDLGAGLSGEIWNARKVFNADPGISVEMYVEYEIELTRTSDGSTVFTKRVRFEQSVLIVAQNRPLVWAIEDARQALITCAGISVAPIRTNQTIPDPNPSEYTGVLGFECRAQSLPEAIALRVFLLIDGTEIEIGSWVQQGAQTTQSGQILEWRLRSQTQEELTAARAVHKKLIEQGTADLLFRTDATLADDTPGIRRVLDLEFVVKDVPVEVVEHSPGSWVNIPNNDFVRAQCPD